jgi:hypothetical protein
VWILTDRIDPTVVQDLPHHGDRDRMAEPDPLFSERAMVLAPATGCFTGASAQLPQERILRLVRCQRDPRGHHDGSV